MTLFAKWVPEILIGHTQTYRDIYRPTDNKSINVLWKLNILFDLNRSLPDFPNLKLPLI